MNIDEIWCKYAITRKDSKPNGTGMGYVEYVMNHKQFKKAIEELKKEDCLSPSGCCIQRSEIDEDNFKDFTEEVKNLMCKVRVTGGWLYGIWNTKEDDYPERWTFVPKVE